MGAFYYTTKSPSRGVVMVLKSRTTRWADGGINYRCPRDPSYGRSVSKRDVFEDVEPAKERIAEKLKRKVRALEKQLEKARAEAAKPIEVVEERVLPVSGR